MPSITQIPVLRGAHIQRSMKIHVTTEMCTALWLLDDLCTYTCSSPMAEQQLILLWSLSGSLQIMTRRTSGESVV